MLWSCRLFVATLEIKVVLSRVLLLNCDVRNMRTCHVLGFCFVRSAEFELAVFGLVLRLVGKLVKAELSTDAV